MERRRRTQQPAWQREAFEDEGLYDAGPVQEEPRAEQVEEIIATNKTVMLTCTLAAMMPLFALFLIFAEKNSRAIRHFALQSVAMSMCHVFIAAMLWIINAVFGVIPFLGFLLNMALWIVYIAAVIVMLILRIRMMNFAWQGIRFVLPVVGAMTERWI